MKTKTKTSTSTTRARNSTRVSSFLEFETSNKKGEQQEVKVFKKGHALFTAIFTGFNC